MTMAMITETITSRTAKSADCERDHSEVSWQATDDLAGADERMASYCVTCESVFLDAASSQLASSDHHELRNAFAGMTRRELAALKTLLINRNPIDLDTMISCIANEGYRRS